MADENTWESWLPGPDSNQRPSGLTSITKPLVALLHSVEPRDSRAVDLANHTIRRHDALAGMNVAYFFAMAWFPGDDLHRRRNVR